MIIRYTFKVEALQLNKLGLRVLRTFRLQRKKGRLQYETQTVDVIADCLETVRLRGSDCKQLQARTILLTALLLLRSNCSKIARKFTDKMQTC
jgi:hypothetical protein